MDVVLENLRIDRYNRWKVPKKPSGYTRVGYVQSRWVFEYVVKPMAAHLGNERFRAQQRELNIDKALVSYDDGLPWERCLCSLPQDHEKDCTCDIEPEWLDQWHFPGYLDRDQTKEVLLDAEALAREGQSLPMLLGDVWTPVFGGLDWEIAMACDKGGFTDDVWDDWHAALDRRNNDNIPTYLRDTN